MISVNADRLPCQAFENGQNEAHLYPTETWVSLQTKPDMLKIKLLHSLTHGTSYPVSICLLKQVF